MNLQHRMGFYKRVAAFAVPVMLAAFFANLFYVPSAKAQTQTGVTLTARAGLDGFCKTGMWFPVRVTVENTGADVDARMQASYANATNGQTSYGVDVSLPATSRKEFFIYVYPDGSIRNFAVSVLEGGQALAKVSLNLSCSYDPVMFFGVIADNLSTYVGLNDLRPLTGTTRVAKLEIADLPDQAQGWEALDALVISNADTGTLDADQVQAMELWLARGGKLFVTGGIHWQAASAGLGGLLPVELNSTKNVTDFSGLGAYVNDETLIEQGGTLATGAVQKSANILVEQNGIPLLVEKQVGFGKVYYFAADPGLQPLSDWDGMKEIYSHLLGFKSPRPVWADASWDSYQVNDALAALPKLELPAFGYICCWLGLYVFVIGPLNYYLLRRIKRTELAWISIPILVVIFTGLAYVSGFAYRGTRPILNRIMLLQGWEGVSRAQANALVGIYSPSRAAYTVETQEQFMLRPLRNVGGSPQSNDNWMSLENEKGTSLPDVRVEIGGMQSIAADGAMPAPQMRHDLVITLGDQIPRLTGTITNTGNTTISGAALATSSGWNVLGDLPPKETVEIDLPLANNTSTAAAGQYSVASLLGYNMSYSYSDDDPEQKRRSAFFLANTNTSNSNVHVNGGVYLMGWVKEISAPASLQGEQSESFDTVLLFEKLNPAVETRPGAITLTSSLYNWESSLGDTLTASYYSISNEGYTLRYQPALPVHFSRVDSLTIHVEATSTPDRIQVSLWNFETDAWEFIPLSLPLYSATIADARQYVGMDGEIRLNIRGNQTDYADITAVDFILTVQP